MNNTLFATKASYGSDIHTIVSVYNQLAQVNRGLEKNNLIFTMNWVKTMHLQMLEKNRTKYFEALYTLYKTKVNKFHLTFFL